MTLHFFYVLWIISFTAVQSIAVILIVNLNLLEPQSLYCWPWFSQFKSQHAQEANFLRCDSSGAASKMLIPFTATASRIPPTTLHQTTASIRAQPHRIPAPRRPAHGAVQLFDVQEDRRNIHPAHWRHGPGSNSARYFSAFFHTIKIRLLLKNQQRLALRCDR